MTIVLKTTLVKSTLGQQTADILRERIIIGTYAQGVRLVEEELASEFDVSRATIREALRLLESEDILIREINKYTYVRILSRSEIISIFAVRTLLERESVAFCIANDCVPVEELHAHLNEMKRVQSIADEWDAYLKADIGFHMAIIKAMGNPYIMKFWKMLQSQYLMAIYMIRAYYPNAFVGTCEEHMELFEGLVKKNDKPWLKHLAALERDISDITEKMKIS